MKIKEVLEEAIIFDNLDMITFDHLQDCCEQNYADFNSLEHIAYDYDFQLPLDFEFVENAGFRFGNKNRMMFFVPCYSEQNGYYSDLIDILYNHKVVLTGGCEWVDY